MQSQLKQTNAARIQTDRLEVRRTIACLIVAAAIFFIGFVARQPDDTASYENCKSIKKLAELIGPASKQYGAEYPPYRPTEADCRPPKWYTVFKRPEGWQLIVATIGITIICWQSWETRRSAKAARKSIELQEIGLTQWVNIENWRASLYQPKDGPIGLSVQFDVVNPTHWPITLSGAFLVFADQPNKVEDRRNLLPPQKSFPIVCQIKITSEQVANWEENELTLFFYGFILFDDILEKRRSQAISGAILCSKKNGAIFIPPYGSGLYVASKNKNTN